jgi:hypothetical protein
VEEQELRIVRRRPWLRGWRIPLVLLLVLLVAALAIVWTIRVRLATDYIDREFARRGVQASYEVKRIGFGSQVLENLVIGDPRRPDATVRRVEVQILVGFTGPRVGLITARGVRMRGRLRGGRLSLGQVDRLLPPPSGLPFRLPDQRVDVADAAILIDTPAGFLALGLAGRGNLSDGFRGHLAAVSRRLALGRCAIAAPKASVAVSVADLRPRFRGPVAIESVRCGNDLAVERPLFALDATLAPAIDSWRGHSALRAARLRAGPNNMTALEGRVTFAGDANRTSGAVDIATASAAADAFRAAATRFAGRYAVSPRRGGNLVLAGDVGLRGLALANADLAGIAGALRSVRGTPLGPIGEGLADALARASRGGGDAAARLTLVNGRGFGAFRLQQLRYATHSGARLLGAGGDGITVYWPSGSLRLDGQFALSGGGFPDTRLTLRQPQVGAPLEGVAQVAPMRAGSARLQLAEIRFNAAPGGRTNFQTAMLVDGPFGGGRVSGLLLPLRGHFGRDGLALGEGCVNASFRALQVEGLRLGPSRLPLCPVGPALVWQPRGGALRAGAELRGARFAGRLGGSPIQLASNRVRVDQNGFSAANVAVRLGAASAVNRLDIARLDGRFVARGVSGAYSGLSGRLANVPLLLSEGAGRWQVVRGNLQLDGGLRIADAVDPPRFYPLASNDFRLTLVNNRIHATGWLNHPPTGTRIALATIDHDLRSGAGNAVLDLPGIAFTEGFQPDALTRLSTGVVALVQGNVTGQGRIAWDARGSRSTGTFSTAGMNFAAPFGPVEGLTTTIEFTDLLGLTSAPGQVAEIDLVRAGIDVYDGRLVYQLQPNYHVAVESGRWPYAGGELLLQPTVLDFSQPSTKHLTFRVVGLDAARFVQLMEFSNISATGTFDGIIPMQFDQSGGRVVGGRLTARRPGGTLSYIGELTDRDLGIYGKMAFDALKELRYDRFDMTLDGDLAGEFVTNIDLDGIARNPSTPIQVPGGAIGRMIAARALSQLAAIPFEFNIRIRGPFRALIATARSFEDPSLLIQPALPRLLRDLPTTVRDVQDEESENQP